MALNVANETPQLRNTSTDESMSSRKRDSPDPDRPQARRGTRTSPTPLDPWHKAANTGGGLTAAASRRRVEPEPDDVEVSNKELLQAINALSIKMDQRIVQLEDNVDQHEAWLGEHEARFNKLEERLNVVEADALHFRLHCEELTKQAQEATATPAQTPGHSVPAASVFERAPDPCLIIANTQHPNTFAREALVHKLGEMLPEANLRPEDAQVISKGTNKRFEINFGSDVMAKQFLASLQDEEGN